MGKVLKLNDLIGKTIKYIEDIPKLHRMDIVFTDGSTLELESWNSDHGMGDLTYHAYDPKGDKQ